MVESLIAWLIVGAIAGWLAGLIVKGFGFGLIGNIVVGIVGAVIAGWLLPQLGIGLGSRDGCGDHQCGDRRGGPAGDHRAGAQSHLTGRRDHLRPGILQCTIGASRVNDADLAP